jgi:transposase
MNELLQGMNKEFEGLYATTGRSSVPPERLMRAVLLEMFYSVRSESRLMEQLDYNLLFRWFVGLEMDEPVWNHAVFSKNRDRLLNQEMAHKFFERVLAQAKPYLSDEHFSVDGTFIEPWASQKSFQRKDGEDDTPGKFRRRKRSNATTNQKPDPEARLYKKGHGQEARLGYLGHVLMENMA